MNLNFDLTGRELSVSIYSKDQTKLTKHLYGNAYVYFLIDVGEIVYIGATVSVYNRICQHRANICYLAFKPFDSFILIQYPDRNTAFSMEKEFINKIKPKFNIKHVDVVVGNYKFRN